MELPEPAYEPWVEGPDPMSEDITEEEVERIAEGAARLMGIKLERH
jgi:hypothetical protein